MLLQEMYYFKDVDHLSYATVTVTFVYKLLQSVVISGLLLAVTMSGKTVLKKQRMLMDIDLKWT